MAYPLINLRFILLISASFIAVFSSIAIYFCLPLLISHVIRTQITLSLGSGSYNSWRLNSVIDRMYLYNITNLSELGSEHDRKHPRPIPHLKEIGPFTFRQDREKINVKFDPLNETVIYDQRKSWTFLPELSVAKSVEEMSSMLINHVSVPLAGTTLNPEYSVIIDHIVSEQDLRLFLNHSVNTLLFEGYYDVLMEQAKASGQIDTDKFGWMHNQNNSLSKPIRVFTGRTNATLNKFGAVDQYDYKAQFYTWHMNGSEPSDFVSATCNNFRFSSAGEFFPPPEDSFISYNHHYRSNQQDQQQIEDTQLLDTTVFSNSFNNISSLSSTDFHSTSRPLDGASFLLKGEEYTTGPILKSDGRKVGKTLSLFMPDLCRTMSLVYNGSYTYRGLMVDRYIANESTYSYSVNKENIDSKDQAIYNDCYCTYNESTKETNCPPNGIMDLFSCRKGSSVSLSFPHFLYSTHDASLSPNLRLFKDDVQANRAEHQLFMDLEPSLNVPVNVQIVFQFNVLLRNDQSMNWMKEYAFLFQDPSPNNGNSKSQVKDFYLPQMWIKSTFEMEESDLTNLKFVQKHLSLVTPITTIIMFGLASILLMASAKLAYDLAYGPNSKRKSSTCDHESCSSLNQMHQCSFMDEKKKKYLDLQLLANEKCHQNACGSNIMTQMDSGGAHCSSTSKKSNNFVISPSSADDNRNECESQPLNR